MSSFQLSAPCTTVDLSKITSSDLLLSPPCCLKTLPTPLISPSPGTFERVRADLSDISPPIAMTWPSLVRTMLSVSLTLLEARGRLIVDKDPPKLISLLTVVTWLTDG